MIFLFRAWPSFLFFLRPTIDPDADFLSMFESATSHMISLICSMVQLRLQLNYVSFRSAADHCRYSTLHYACRTSWMAKSRLFLLFFIILFHVHMGSIHLTLYSIINWHSKWTRSRPNRGKIFLGNMAASIEIMVQLQGRRNTRKSINEVF